MAVPTDEVIYQSIPSPESWVEKMFLSPRFDYFRPEPGERSIGFDTIWLGYGEGDDGGGAALAAYRYGLCPFVQ